MPLNNSQKSNFIMVGIVVAVIAVGALLVFVAQPSAVSQKAPIPGLGSALTAEPRTYDFGKISMAQGKVNTKFTIKNPSQNPITVQKLYTSCMCTSASLVRGDSRVGPFGMQGHGFIPTIKETIGAGEEAQVEVTFDPAAHGPAGVGSISRNVYIETTDGAKFSVGIEAEVTP